MDYNHIKKQETLGSVRELEKLTDTDGQLRRSPRPISLTISVGPSDQIETRRAVVGHLFLLFLFFL